MLESSRVITMKKKHVLICATALLLTLTGCNKKPANAQEETLTKYSNTTFDSGFDTVITLMGYTKTQEEFDSYFNQMKDTFSRYNKLFNVYNDYEGINNIKTINDQAGIAPVEVDPEILEMLKVSKEFYDLSDGEFDITMGSVLKIWHTYREEGMALNEEGKLGNVPSTQELEKAAGCAGWDKVQIDEQAKTVYLTQNCASLDVGGIAKGFTAEKAAQQLETAGLVHGTVDAGGNVRTINDKPGNQSWVIGIRNPNLKSEKASLDAVAVPASSSFVSSGDYERFYLASDNKSYHHIIDPRTLMPSDLYHQVTVVTKNSGYADALSTSLFTMPLEKGSKFVESYNLAHPEDMIRVMWVVDKDKKPEGMSGFEFEDYYVVYTENIKDYLSSLKK